jgi:hypothetical protein
MSQAADILTENKRMYNRLFWIDLISRLWALGGGLWTLWLIVQTVLNTRPGAHVLLTLPVSQDYPAQPGTLSYSGGPYVLQGTTVQFTEATMTVAHLSTTTVIMLGLGEVFAAATSAGIAYCIFLLARRLRAGQPFAASAARTLVVAGLILGIGSTASNLLHGIGQATAFNIMYMAKYGNMQIGGSSTTFIDFVPLFFAGLLFALAGVFRYGAALQRETDGLV